VGWALADAAKFLRAWVISAVWLVHAELAASVCGVGLLNKSDWGGFPMWASHLKALACPSGNFWVCLNFLQALGTRIDESSAFSRHLRTGDLLSNSNWKRTGAKMEIELSAENEESESYRIARLERVVGYLCALADHYGNDRLMQKIQKLHDHKGILNVLWKVKPTPGELEIILRAWGSSIGDRCDNVEHEFPK